jgi:endonuclease G
VKSGDYTHSGFDRGHMAPNFGIATRYGREGQLETFLMSNIIPQDPSVNQGIWKHLEMRIARRYGLYFSEVWVITGPIFQKPVSKLESGVAIPEAYYKIIADEHGGHLRTLSFIFEMNCPPYTRIKKRLVSIDEIEEKTGLNFFPDLAAEQQDELESAPAGRLWPLPIPAVKYHLNGKTY